VSVSLCLAGTEAEGRPEVSRRFNFWMLQIGLPVSTLLVGLFAYGIFTRAEWLTDVLGWLDQYDLYIILFIILWNVFAFGTMWLLRKWYGIRFPPLDRVRVLHKENFASGTGVPVFFGMGGNCSNCLVLIVTEDELWTTAWFPFTTMIELCGLEHRIRKEDIVRVRKHKGLFFHGIQVAFKTRRGDLNICLASHHQDKFLAALDHDGALKASGRMEAT